MMPTADEVAVAIVTAARLVGADPEETLTYEPASNYDREKRQLASRARAYAARAIDKVFNRPTLQVPRPVIARLVNVSRASQQCYFGALDARQVTWWSEDIFKAVVNAVMDAEPDERPAAPPTPPPAPPPKTLPAVYKHTPVVRAAVAVGGHGRPQTGLDAFSKGIGKSASRSAGGDLHMEKRVQESRNCKDILAEAARNTLRLQKLLPDS